MGQQQNQQQQQQTMEQVVLNRLAGEIGTLRAQLIQAQTYIEVLEAKVKESEAKESGDKPSGSGAE
jgi:septal ring factor EnvC (AmiA/AmiB activator)